MFGFASECKPRRGTDSTEPNGSPKADSDALVLLEGTRGSLPGKRRGRGDDQELPAPGSCLANDGVKKDVPKHKSAVIILYVKLVDQKDVTSVDFAAPNPGTFSGATFAEFWDQSAMSIKQFETHHCCVHSGLLDFLVEFMLDQISSDQLGQTRSRVGTPHIGVASLLCKHKPVDPLKPRKGLECVVEFRNLVNGYSAGCYRPGGWNDASYTGHLRNLLVLMTPFALPQSFKRCNWVKNDLDLEEIFEGYLALMSGLGRLGWRHFEVIVVVKLVCWRWHLVSRMESKTRRLSGASGVTSAVWPGVTPYFLGMKKW